MVIKTKNLPNNNKQDVRYDNTLSVHSSSHLYVDDNFDNFNDFDVDNKSMTSNGKIAPWLVIWELYLHYLWKVIFSIELSLQKSIS